MQMTPLPPAGRDRTQLFTKLAQVCCCLAIDLDLRLDVRNCFVINNRISLSCSC